MAQASRRVLGAAGESAAAAWLEARGWAILARNVRTRYGEVDLVVRRGDLVVLVEVKSRTGDGFGHPAEAVVRDKQRRIARLAPPILRRFGAEGCAVRFDAVAVHLDRGGQVRGIEHIPDAFWGEG